MFQTKAAKKTKKHVLFSITFFFRKLYPLLDNAEKYGTAVRATDDNIGHAHCLLDT